MLKLLRRLFGDRHADDATSIKGYPDFRYNYRLGIVNGVFFNTGMSFFNRTTIIPLFMASLGAPSILIAFLSLAETLGWHLPQFFASRLIVHKSLKMPLYRNAALLRVTGMALAVAAAWSIPRMGEGWGITLFTLGFGMFSLASGFGGIVFMEILAKTVPAVKRGSYFGWRAILSGVVGLFLGVGVINPIFAGIAYPHNYAVSFAIGLLMIAIRFYLFLQQSEPVQTDLPPKRSFAEQLELARDILRNDKRFRRLVIFRSLMMLWFSSLPFYMLFAKERLDATNDEVGLFISWEFAGMIVANIVWGFLSNRIGNRVLLITVCTLAALVSLGTMLFDAAALPTWIFGMVFFLSAAVDSGSGTGGINYALEIVPEAERPTYIGLMHSLLAGALILAAITGSLRDVIGYVGLFGVTAVVAIIALIIAIRMPEPRRGT
ncbi:MAG: MFS transporter [bacterium]|nr:MFS transporter [Candidatus Kapabacteria bacterium]